MADDIAANGLLEPVTLTPDGQLLDGRNRALACVMAGVELKTVTYDGNPVLYSLSKNQRRRHLTTDQIAMAVAKVTMRPLGANQHEGGSGELPSIAQAAAAAGIPETAIKSAKVVRLHGTPEEIKRVETGAVPLRKTADQVRAGKRSPAPVKKAEPKKFEKTPAADGGPVDAVAREIISKTSAGPSVHAISKPRSDDAVEAGPASPTREEKTNTARIKAAITIAKMIASHTVTSM